MGGVVDTEAAEASSSASKARMTGLDGAGGGGFIRRGGGGEAGGRWWGGSFVRFMEEAPM